MKNFLFLLFLLITCLSCGKKYTPVPGHIIQPAKFTKILMDIRLAESNHKLIQQHGYREENLLDSSYNLVYKIHNISADRMQESYDFYVLHTEWMNKITNDVIDKLNQLEH